MLKVVLEELWPGPRDATRFDMRAVGVRLPLPGGEHLVVRLDLRAVICDHAALAAGLGLKGASGTKPCHICTNVVSAGAGRDPGGSLAGPSSPPGSAIFARSKALIVRLGALEKSAQDASSSRGGAGCCESEARPAHGGHMACPAAAPGGRGFGGRPQDGSRPGGAGPRHEVQRRRAALCCQHTGFAAAGPAVLRPDAPCAQQRSRGEPAGWQGAQRPSQVPPHGPVRPPPPSGSLRRSSGPEPPPRPARSPDSRLRGPARRGLSPGLLAALKTHGIEPSALDEYCAAWRAPAGLASTGGRPLPEGWFADRFKGAEGSPGPSV